MKKTLTILGSAVGGAVIGSAVTMFICPKTGAEMRKKAHSKIMDQLSSIQETISKCTEMISGGACKCNENKEAEM